MFLAGIVLLLGTAFSAPQERSRQISVGVVENPATLDALVATCTGIVDWETKPNLMTRLPWPPSDVPVEQQISQALQRPVAVRPGFYGPGDKNTPSVSDLAAYMYRGGVVIWYSDAENDPAISGLESLLNTYTSNGGSAVAVAWPKDQMSRFPSLSRTIAGRKLLLTKWGSAQSCAVASAQVLDQFVEHANMADESAP